MDKESQTCGLCSRNYNTTDRIPRVLSCAHTLCSLCLAMILDTPNSRNCPFDSNAFSEAQRSLESFPLNFALLTLLEREKQKICQVHGEELTDICFQDKVKICSECASEEHKGHSTRKIKDLKIKGTQVKNDLLECLTKFEKNPFEKNKEVEKIKNQCMGQMGDKFEEINKTLKDKQQEWRKQIESFFEREIDNQLKEDASKLIQEIDQAFKNEENLVLLDRDFSSIVSKLQPQVVSKEEVSSLSDDITRTMDSLESFLTNQISSLNKFHLPNDQRKPEEPMAEEKPEQQEHPQVPSENHIEDEQKPGVIKVSKLVRLRLLVDSFCVHINNHTPQNLSLDVAKYPKIPQMFVRLEGYENFFKDPADLNCLTQILNEFNSYNRLNVEFKPFDLNDDYALRLFNVLFCRIQNLTHLKINLGESGISDEPILYFCEHILPKAISLKYLTLKLNETKITNESIFKLAESLAPWSTKLKGLTVNAAYTGIQGDAIEELFDVIMGARTLRLYLEGTGVTDHCLKMLGNKVMPKMRNLEKFSLNVKETEITIEGVGAIFKGVPKGIRGLNLGFENDNLPDDVLYLFEQNVCPKLQLVKDLSLRLEGSDSENDDDDD